MSHTVFLSIGSNIGNAVENCNMALELIAKREGIKILKTSSFYRTEPWGGIEQEWFVNCVTKIETSLSVSKLFKNLQQIEMDLGRKNTSKGYPRVIDIDMLFFDSRVIEGGNLIIPHPLLHKRAFVLIPFREIEPLFIHPVLSKTINQLRIELKDAKQVIRLEGVKCGL
ncbi:MAG: 2-amino-4-hydroxy-6-hydroxymethyldihydropteridine diphosphokinase [Deltaproteobacteria bacterium]|nr:2-amino-4-hydroxy-6-hydroxymethyldihydropteridine diphosphokinase [Deltaproteobacteria bacterium]